MSNLLHMYSIIIQICSFQIIHICFLYLSELLVRKKRIVVLKILNDALDFPLIGFISLIYKLVSSSFSCKCSI